MLIAACVSMPLSEPKPQSDLSADAALLTIDLTRSAGVKVWVQGQDLDLLVLPHADSLIILNKEVADDLNLKPVMWGLGAVSISDGDYRVGGRAYNVSYRFAASSEELAWALVLDENICEGFDGAISFGAIPARKFRILLNPRNSDLDTEIRNLVLAGKSKALEANRDYNALDFSRTLALYREPTIVNRKATDYIIRSGAGEDSGVLRSITRLFKNNRPHARLKFEPALDIDGFRVDEVWGELTVPKDGVVEPDLIKERDADTRIEDTIIVSHDRKSPRYAPEYALGRAFFKGCPEMYVDKQSFRPSDEITVAVHCEVTPSE